jgi:hypothetical protein
MMTSLAPLVAVISDGYWERVRPSSVRGGEDRDQQPVTIVVSPRLRRRTSASAEITVTVAAVPQLWPSMADMAGPGNFWLRVLARPAAGLSTKDAASRLNAVWPALADSLLSARWPTVRRQSMADSAGVTSIPRR